MTLLVVISDIHGNGIVIEKFLSEMDKIKPDAIICLGDTIGYLDEEVMCYEILNSIKSIHLMGNHEAMILGLLDINSDFKDIYKLHEAKKRLPIELLENIKKFPHEKKWIEGKFHDEFYHGAPDNPINGRVYFNTIIQPKSNQTNFVFVGNTHRSFNQLNDWGMLINVGSLGLPRDNGALGTYIVVDTEKNLVSRKFIYIDLNNVLRKYKSIHPSVMANFYKCDPIADFV